MRLILGSRIDEARRSQYEEVEKMVTVYEQMGMEKETWIEGYSGCVHREVSGFHLFPNFDEVNWSENSH